jgi:hypothetical protein
MPDANLAAALAGIRDRSERPVPGVSALPVSNPAVRSFMESAADVPRLLAAVEAMLGHHVPRAVTVHRTCFIHRRGSAFRRGVSVSQWKAEVEACVDCSRVDVTQCAACDPVCPDDNVWPCADVKAISAALLGEDAEDSPVIDMGYMSLPGDVQADIERGPR